MRCFGNNCNIIGCSRCISLCSVMGVGVGVEGGCGYLWVFSDIKSIENCGCKKKNGEIFGGVSVPELFRRG